MLLGGSRCASWNTGKALAGKGSKIYTWRGIREGFLEEATPQLTWLVSESWKEGAAFQADGRLGANTVSCWRREAALSPRVPMPGAHASKRL